MLYNNQKEGVNRMDIELLPALSGWKSEPWAQLLERCGLTHDRQADTILLVWENDALIATGSRLGNLLKCIAVDSSHQGQDLTATVLTHLRQDALQAGHRHLFLYTKPRNKYLFSSLFFYPIAQTDSVLLMENKPDGIGEFLDSLPVVPTNGTVGATVMNCNPFTRGHRYLIETAARDCARLYVFVLSEDKSHFRAEDRMAMVKAGTADIPNVTVLPTGPYLISAATFPTYFLKEQAQIQDAQCELDVAVFAKYYAPKFGITRRYVGTEPFCGVTAQYNSALERFLPAHGITLCQIPRLETGSVPISASAVRELLAAGDREAIASLVPQSTYDYLLHHDLL